MNMRYNMLSNIQKLISSLFVLFSYIMIPPPWIVNLGNKESEQGCNGCLLLSDFYFVILYLHIVFRFDTLYLDDDIRVVKDIRGDYLVVDRAPYAWKE